ncbi:dolichyl-phosphate beta-glucosyltransferase [Apiospora aurea]|uniref:dolichyl-phosphate beta-glucosyltransferase n=1 Tax=Apiospora aurea TaxID=335848 RepID=A0ABR1QJ47_9PEZI
MDDALSLLARAVGATPVPLLILAFAALLVTAFYTIYAVLHFVAPNPRAVLSSEKTYKTTTPDGKVVTRQLPCWHDRWLAERHASENRATQAADGPLLPIPDTGSIEPAEIRLSVVIPAYNEEKRILPALEDAVKYLDAHFGRESQRAAADNGDKEKKKGAPSPTSPRWHHRIPPEQALTGYEIIIVNDGSRDRTEEVVLDFARRHALHDVLRLVTLERNRGKGGGVTHGLRHARGEFALFADADGASKFSDLGKLIEGCEDVTDAGHRGVAIGSRGHLVGSEAVVKRSALRNFLMRGFHFILMILTPPATSRLRDTQCGFKLFSRQALPHIVPYMHAEGWIFDIEMLMLAESAPAVPVLSSEGAVIGSSPGIKVAEVPIDWHEVDGSKLNVIQDSVRMAVGLAVLRASWMMGVYRRRLT